MLVAQLTALLILFILLSKSADLVVEALTALGRTIHLTDFAVGFLFLGLATSTPELFVGITSAVDEIPQLSLGNLFGASIVLLTLIAGLTAIIQKRVLLGNSFDATKALLTTLVIVSPLPLLADGILSEREGVILLVVYASHLLFFIRENHLFSHHFSFTNLHQRSGINRAAFQLVGGLIGLIFCAKAIVSITIVLAAAIQMPLFLVGVIMLALGTNLPELSVALRATASRHTTMALGNIMNSAAVNTAILGFVAILRPIYIRSGHLLVVSAIFLLVAAVLLSVFVTTKRTLSRREGFVLLGIYVLFIATETLSKLWLS